MVRKSYKTAFLLIILVFLSSSCGTASVADEHTFTPAQTLVVLPDTWTPIPTLNPSCTPSPEPTFTPTQVPTQIPTSTLRPSQTPSQTVTPEPTFQLPDQGLSPQGPWLVYWSRFGYLAAIDQDGSGRRIITKEDPADSLFTGSMPFPAYLSPSPGGSYLAYRTALGEHNLKLTITHLPDGKQITSFPLLSQENAGYFTAEIVSTPAWSPSGRYLAFIGGMDGPSPNLYLYDLRLNTIRRLTEDPTTAGFLTWSPDSNWIVHEEVARFHRMIPGWRQTNAVWAAAADGSVVKKLYDYPSETTYQDILGWISADRFLVSFYNPYDSCMNKAYLVEISESEYFLLPYRGFNSMALAPEEGSILFSVSQSCQSQASLEPGLYHASLPEGDPSQLQDDLGDPFWYPELNSFLVSFNGYSKLISMQGEIQIELPGIKAPIYPSPSGSYLGYAESVAVGESGLRIDTLSGEMIQEFMYEFYFREYPYDMFWIPEGTGYIFRGAQTTGPGHNLYLVKEPGQEPILIANDFSTGTTPSRFPDAAWVLP